MKDQDKKCPCGSVQFSYGGRCLACGKTEEEREIIASHQAPIPVEGSTGGNGYNSPVHLPPTGQNGYGETVGCQCEKCLPQEEKTTTEGWEKELASHIERCFSGEYGDTAEGDPTIIITAFVHNLLSSERQRMVEVAKKLVDEFADELIDLAITNTALRGCVTSNQIIDTRKNFWAHTHEALTDKEELKDNLVGLHENPAEMDLI